LAIKVTSRGRGTPKWNRKLQGSAVRARCGAQVGDHRSHDVRRSGLRRRIAIRQRGDRQHTEYGNQTKGGDTKGES